MIAGLGFSLMQLSVVLTLLLIGWLLRAAVGREREARLRAQRDRALACEEHLQEQISELRLQTRLVPEQPGPREQARRSHPSGRPSLRVVRPQGPTR